MSLYSLLHDRNKNLPDLKEEDTSPTLKRFFKLLGRKFWKLISLNLMMLPLILPIAIAVFLYLGINKTPSESSVIFSQIYGANLIQSTPESIFLLDIFGAQFMIPAYHNAPTYIGIGICALFLLVTFGWQNVGATYILRGIVRGDPVFLWSDYFYAVKRNFWQGMVLGILDFVAIFLLVFDIMYFWGQTGTSFYNNVMFYAFMAVAILYFFMRFYIYHLQITFKLSIRKIYKNALIFTTLGIKRNLMALLGLLIMVAGAVAFAALLIVIFGFNSLGIPLILPFLYFLSFSAFITSYAAYPVIDRYMIAPYVTKEDPEDEEDPGEGSEEKTENEEA